MKKFLIALSLILFLQSYSDMIPLRIFDDMSSVETSESEHFIYTYKSDFANEIQRVASIAEGLYENLSRKMNAKTRTKISIVITDQSDLPNGFASPFLNPLINIYLANPDPSFIAKHSDWVEYVLLHELTHILHLSSTRPSCLSYTQNSLLYIPNVVYPMYFLEGYTVYNESVMMNGRMKDTNFEAILRTMHIDSAIQPIGNAVSYFNRDFPFGQLPYIYGSYVFDKYIEKNNAQLTSLTKLDMCSCIPLSALFPDIALAAAMGSFPADMLKEVYKDVSEKTEKIKSENVFSSRKNVTLKGHSNSLPFYSNEELYYSKSFPHKGDVIVRNVSGKEEELFPSIYPTNICVENNKMYIDMASLYRNTNIFYDIYEYDIMSGDLNVLPHTTRGFSPSAKGDTLLFIRNSLDKQRVILYSLSKKECIDSFIVENDWKYYSLSIKNFNSILLSCHRVGGYTDIVLFDIEKKNYSLLTSDKDVDHSPQWSKNRDGFYFISDKSGINKVYFYDMRDTTISAVYASLYNVLSYSVDEENNLIYVQDISRYGSDIYSAVMIESEKKALVFEEAKLPNTYRKENITIKEKGSYMLPKFSGPGAYAFLPISLPAEDTVTGKISFVNLLPFAFINADVAHALTLFMYSIPIFELDLAGRLLFYDYPSYINVTSCHFPFDLALTSTFQRNLYPSDDTIKLPFEISMALSASIPLYTLFFSRTIEMGVIKSYYRDDRSTGLEIGFSYSSYDGSVKSVIPSFGYGFSSGVFLKRDDLDRSFSYGAKADYSYYYSPAHFLNLFVEGGAMYAPGSTITTGSEMKYLIEKRIIPKLDLSTYHDGMRGENYDTDFAYVKTGFLSPVKFINKSIPFKFFASWPVRFDYISCSASQLIGYSFSSKKADLVTRASVNLSIYLSALFIYPGISVTYNAIDKRFGIGITASIK